MQTSIARIFLLRTKVKEEEVEELVIDFVLTEENEERAVEEIRSFWDFTGTDSFFNRGSGSTTAVVAKLCSDFCPRTTAAIQH